MHLGEYTCSIFERCNRGKRTAIKSRFCLLVHLASSWVRCQTTVDKHNATENSLLSFHWTLTVRQDECDGGRCESSSPQPLQASSSLQMFTVLSIDPVAISGEVGEMAHAVTYLQEATPVSLTSSLDPFHHVCASQRQKCTYSMYIHIETR